MILADTSAWIEFDRATGSPCQPATELALRWTLGRYELLSFDPVAEWSESGGRVRRLRPGMHEPATAAATRYASRTGRPT